MDDRAHIKGMRRRVPLRGTKFCLLIWQAGTHESLAERLFLESWKFVYPGSSGASLIIKQTLMRFQSEKAAAETTFSYSKRETHGEQEDDARELPKLVLVLKKLKQIK